jgi:glycosyltransferase involved in cell wall biosynthesis
MRILFVHNRYRQAGGEDRVVAAESRLLARMGHEVELWEENNDSIVSRIDAVKTGFQSLYSIRHADQMKERIRAFRPDVVHIHNFFPRMSPSIHRACFRDGVPVVQTLHNFRLLCPAATLNRRGRECEECVGRLVPWPSVLHGCYRNSRAASAAVASMLSMHRGLGTWYRSVSRFIALTEFARAKFIAGGFPEDKIAIKPNFVDPDPGIGSGQGNFALFVGRLAEEKGIGTLLAAWSRLAVKPRLKIIGDGPLAKTVVSAAATIRKIEWLGLQSREEVRRMMADATVLIVPSTWFEGFPLVIGEAFAAGVPIIASRIGGLTELIADRQTGRLVSPGDLDELCDAIRWVFSEPEEWPDLRLRARMEFERKYTAEANYARLVAIYEEAIESCAMETDLGNLRKQSLLEMALHRIGGE